MSELKGLGDMKHDLKHGRSAFDDELANELGLSSKSRAVERHGVSSEVLAVGHDHGHVNDMEVDGPEYMDTEVAMTSSNMKRGSDVPLEDLEEIRKETDRDRQNKTHVLSSMVSAAFGVTDYVPLSDLLVDSVQFGTESDFAVMTFGSQKIKIWKPSSAVDDSDVSELLGIKLMMG